MQAVFSEITAHVDPLSLDFGQNIPEHNDFLHHKGMKFILEHVELHDR